MRGPIILVANRRRPALAARVGQAVYFATERSAGDPEASGHPASQHETKGTKVTSSYGPCPAERDARARVGFVGAGKIGFALGLHLHRSGARISGYASRTEASARWAAQCTDAVAFSSLQALLDSSDIIFIAVPDAQIAQVGCELAAAAALQGSNALTGKVVCHCSGAAASDELSACRGAGAACASVHPMVAVPDVPQGETATAAPVAAENEAETEAGIAYANCASTALGPDPAHAPSNDPGCVEACLPEPVSTGDRNIPDRLSSTFFTLEGDAEAVSAAEALLDAAGNRHRAIAAADKVRYHAAAVFMSNLVCGLAFEGLGLLEDCGFTADEALAATTPLFTGNADAIAERGPVAALSGPIERGDAETVRAHLAALDGQALATYATLSLSVCEAAQARHPERNLKPIARMLREAAASPAAAPPVADATAASPAAAPPVADATAPPAP